MASPIVAMEAVIWPKKGLQSRINAAMECDLAHHKERDHGYEDIMKVRFTYNNTSSGVNLFNAEPLPTAYTTVPSAPLETYACVLHHQSYNLHERLVNRAQLLAAT